MLSGCGRRGRGVKGTRDPEEGPFVSALRAENRGGGMPKGCIFELLVEEGSTGMQGGMWRAGDGVADAAAGTPCLPRHNFVDTQRRKKHM